MTITKVKMASEIGGQTEQGPTYERVYRVHFKDGFSAAALIVNTESALPKYGYPLRSPDGTTVVDATVYMHDVDIRLEDASAFQEGIALYLAKYKMLIPSVLSVAGGSLAFEPDPLSRKPEIRGGGSDVTEIRTHDSEGLAIVNVVGDFVDPLPPRPVQGREIEIIRNEASNPAERAKIISNTVCSEDFFGAPIGTARMGKIQFDGVHEVVNGVIRSYWRVVYPIFFRNDDWRFYFINSGFHYRDEDNNTQKFRDPNTGEPSATPGLLDADGGKLADGAAGVLYPPDGDGYKLMREFPWSQLDLPNPFE